MRSRLRVAVAGALVAGVVAALVAWQTGSASGQPGGSAAFTSGPGVLGQATLATIVPSPAATATVRPTATTVPTRAPNPTPTPRPCPTPTQPPVGVQVTLRGDIAGPPNQSANSFPFHISCGSTITVIVNSQTTYSGQATGLSSLQQGWHAHVTGAYQSDGTFLAVNVDAFIDN